MKTITKSPADCSTEELDDFCRIVRAAGEVDPYGLKERVRCAKAVAFAISDGETLGVAALKVPDENYRQSVFTNAKANRSACEYPFEVGWVVVDDHHRGKGLSRILVEATLTAAGDVSVFATSASSREPMHRTLRRLGFVQAGEPYLSRRRNSDLLLFVRDGPV